MKVSDQDSKWRAALHAKLDAILDMRAAVETAAGIADEVDHVWLGSRSYAHLSTSLVGSKARALLTLALQLAGEASGKRVRSMALQTPANDSAQQRQVLRDWVVLFEPILDLPQPTLMGGDGNACLSESTVWLALRALDGGEVWPIFEPGKRGNRPANAYSLSVARLSALEWKRRLLSLGHTEGEGNRDITAAFGEQWDTIRKWERSCRAMLGDGFVTAALDRADRDEKYRTQSRGLNPLLHEPSASRLKRAGEYYRSEKRRAAELSPSKRRAARRAENQPA